MRARQWEWTRMISTLLCGAHPKLSPGRIVQIFKSITAREIFARKPSVKKHPWGGEFWTDGYYVAAVGERADRRTLAGMLLDHFKYFSIVFGFFGLTALMTFVVALTLVEPLETASSEPVFSAAGLVQ